MQTVQATVDLCHYLLDNDDEINYILLGFLKQDWLAGRFGWYRQLSGGNYYQSVLRFLQSEITIRLRNLITSGYNMTEIAGIFSDIEDVSNVIQESINLNEMLNDFRFSKHHSDVAITYYVAGYVCRGLTRQEKCADCRTLFSNGEPLEINIDFNGPTSSELEIGRAFLAAINRGGLIKPSDICYITCLHTADLYEYISDGLILMKELLSSRHPRALFVEVRYF